MARDSQKFSFIIGLKDRFSKQWKTVKGHLVSGARFARNIGLAFTGAATASAALFGKLFVDAVKANDTLAKTASKLGATTEELAGLRHAAELAGIGTNTMDMALQRMVRRLSEAANGSGEAKGAIEELGLDAKELASLTPGDALQRVVQALQGVANQGDRVRLAFKFFDSEGVSMVNLTADGLEKAKKEAELLGIAISKADANRFEKISDNLDIIKSAIKGAANSFSLALAPAIDAISGKLVELAKSGKLTSFAKEFGEKFVQVLLDGVLLFVQLAGKAVFIFSGWKMLIKEIEIQWLNVLLTIQKVIEFTSKALALRTNAFNFGGVLDEELKKKVAIAKEQERIRQEIEKDRDAALAAQNSLVAGHKKEQDELDDLAEKVGVFVESLRNASESQKAGAENTATHADNMTRLANEADRAANSFARIENLSANLKIPTGQRVLSNTGISIQPEDTEGSE